MSSTFLAGSLVAAPAAQRGRQARMVVRAADSLPSWCPGAPRPAHLKGELAGDYGYDPLSLGKDPDALKYYVQAEIVHARFAMAGWLGMIVPDILSHAGVGDFPVWWEAGKVAQENSDIPFNTLLMTQFLAMSFAEHKRIYDTRNPQSQGKPGSFVGFEAALGGTGDNGYPGGVFDPLNLSKGDLEGLKFKEIINGRLAMLATLGFYAQAAATGKSPVDNWLDHIADPFGVNFGTNGVSVPYL